MSDFGGSRLIQQFATNMRSALDPFVYCILYFLSLFGLSESCSCLLTELVLFMVSFILFYTVCNTRIRLEMRPTEYYHLRTYLCSVSNFELENNFLVYLVWEINGRGLWETAKGLAPCSFII